MVKPQSPATATTTSPPPPPPPLGGLGEGADEGHPEDRGHQSHAKTIKREWWGRQQPAPLAPFPQGRPGLAACVTAEGCPHPMALRAGRSRAAPPLPPSQSFEMERNGHDLSARTVGASHCKS